MMQTYGAFKLEEYNQNSIGLNRDKQLLNYNIDSENIITVSMSKIWKTYGKRYVKSILSSSYVTFRELGSPISNDPNYNHRHNVPDYNNGGCITGSNTRGNQADFEYNINPKYHFLGNWKFVLSQLFTLPQGTILFSSVKKPLLSNFTYLDEKYLYLGASIDGGTQNHTHNVNTSTVGGGSCGANYDVQTTQINISNTLNPETLNNDIPDRVELFTIEYTGNYYKDRDIIEIGGMVLQDKFYSIPSNYSEVTLSGTGLLRFADIIGEIDINGGTETHNHPISTTNSWLTTSSSRPYLTNIQDGNHIPPYKAVRVIQRDS